MTLDAAMSAVASRMGGVCELDSQDWIEPWPAFFQG